MQFAAQSRSAVRIAHFASLDYARKTRAPLGTLS